MSDVVYPTSDVRCGLSDVLCLLWVYQMSDVRCLMSLVCETSDVVYQTSDV